MARHRALAREAIARAAPFPEGRFAGRGVVICGGGLKYFPPAWVCIRMLRHVGCTLPIELWHLGPREMSDAMRALVAPHDVTCVDGLRVREDHPARRLNGWELKPYAIIHSRFEQVLFLDADNVPVVDPAFLFEREEYRCCGAVFWPDFNPIDRKNDIWEVAEVEYRYEPSFETGQIVVDKRRAWDALQLTMHYNEYSDFYYRHTGGDKDTFHIAWRRLDRPYALIPHHVHAMTDRVMNQHDFEGRVIFHHRNNAKWTLDLAANPRVAGFREEQRCLDYLYELAARWPGDPARIAPDSPRARRAWDAIVATERFLYHRIGHDRRILRLRADQEIEGDGKLEASWHVRTREQVELCICGADSVTCALTERPDGVWVGRWEQHERMPIELVPIAQVAPDEQLVLQRDAREAALAEARALLVRVRRDRQVVRCEPDGRLITDRGDPTGWRWGIHCLHGELALQLVDPEGGVRLLREDPDGIFREPGPGPRDRLELIVLPGARVRELPASHDIGWGRGGDGETRRTSVLSAAARETYRLRGAGEARWSDGDARPEWLDDITGAERAARAALIAQRRFRYRSIGEAEWPLQLLPGGALGHGDRAGNAGWDVEEDAPGEVSLVLRAGDGIATRLVPTGDGAFAGRRPIGDRAPVRVEPFEHGPGAYLLPMFTACLARDRIRRVVEVGSGDGADAVLLQRYFDADLLTFECSPDALPICAERLAGEPRIELIPRAVGDRDGPVTFHRVVNGNRYASSCLRANPSYPYERYQQEACDVEMVRLDRVLAARGIDAIDLLVIDVQGSCLEVLRGLGERLARVRYIIAELETRTIYDGEALAPEVIDLLAGHGFHLLRSVNQWGVTPAGHLVDSPAYLPQFAGAESWFGDYLFVRHTPREAEVARDLVARGRFRYARLGFDERVLALLPGGQIGEGSGPCEQSWIVEARPDGTVELALIGIDQVTCRLTAGSDGRWRGRWIAYERMPILLEPM